MKRKCVGLCQGHGIKNKSTPRSLLLEKERYRNSVKRKLLGINQQGGCKVAPYLNIRNSIIFRNNNILKITHFNKK